MRYSATTNLPPAAVLQRAIETFGHPSFGLQMTGRGLLDVRFDGSFGHIAVEANRSEPAGTEVLIETAGFDDEVLAFIHDLPRESWFKWLLGKLRSK